MYQISGAHEPGRLERCEAGVTERLEQMEDPTVNSPLNPAGVSPGEQHHAGGLPATAAGPREEEL